MPHYFEGIWTVKPKTPWFIGRSCFWDLFRSHVPDIRTFLLHLFYFLKIIFVYLRERERTRQGCGGGWEAQKEKQRARCGTPSQDPEFLTWARGRRSTIRLPRHPSPKLFYIVYLSGPPEKCRNRITGENAWGTASRRLSGAGGLGRHLTAALPLSSNQVH